MADVSALPTLAPDDHTQKCELPVSSDPNFAVHGEIMMVVLLLLFASFLLFILLYYCMCAKRLKDASKVTRSETISPRNFTTCNFKDQIRDGYLTRQSMVSNTAQQPV
ncbi:hypothetical protein OIU74_029403 [Salix koriyanagi]|uniref:Uncharacterized protein n=1 Tax=Salix koriyanagi TaxID=2511006 RepID=A0A9Q0VDT4_9ROSI|nr:hypothetical protein OIU74_029403 [Salix koriyanagi]